MQVKRKHLIGKPVLQRADNALDPERRSPRHGVGELNSRHLQLMLGCDVEHEFHQLDNAFNRHVSFEIAPKRTHQRYAIEPGAGALVHFAQDMLTIGLFFHRPILVSLQEFLGRRMSQASVEIEPSGRDRPFVATLVQPEAGIRHARLAGDSRNDRFGIGLPRNKFGIHEGNNLDCLETGFGQRVDQFDFPLRRNSPFLELKSFAWALLFYVDELRKIGFRQGLLLLPYQPALRKDCPAGRPQYINRRERDLIKNAWRYWTED